jgi:hypothetical protein
MRVKKTNKIKKLPKGVTYNPELDKSKNVIGGRAKELARANEILEKTPIPQWILDL